MTEDELTKLLPEIALEMTTQTGLIFICPAENLIFGPDCAYHVRARTWPRPMRLAVDYTGPNNRSMFRTETITLDPARPPAALARDILRRLPLAEAQAFYARAQSYLDQETAVKRAQENLAAELTALNLTTYREGQFHDYNLKTLYSVETRAGEITDIRLTHVPLDQFRQILQILRNSNPDPLTCAHGFATSCPEGCN